MPRSDPSLISAVAVPSGSLWVLSFSKSILFLYRNEKRRYSEVLLFPTSFQRSTCVFTSVHILKSSAISHGCSAVHWIMQVLRQPPKSPKAWEKNWIMSLIINWVKNCSKPGFWRGTSITCLVVALLLHAAFIFFNWTQPYMCINGNINICFCDDRWRYWFNHKCKFDF